MKELFRASLVGHHARALYAQNETNGKRKKSDNHQTKFKS